MIELRHVKKAFGANVILEDVSTTIREGDVIAVIGPSGTGKSTLLRCINLLDPPSDGDIFVDGACITAHGFDAAQVRRKVGMVFQSFNLFENLTAIENVMVPQLELLERPRQEAYEKGKALLAEVGLAEKMLQYPDAMSGGQKQRVAIARTLAMDPEVILLDEPTSALDPAMVREVQHVIKKLSRDGHTMMIVTHEMRFAREVSNRVFYMDERGIYEDGTPEQIFEHPQREKTRRFIRNISVLEVLIDSPRYDYPRTVAEIETWCEKNQLSHERTLRVISVFEELCQHILLPQLGEQVRLFMTLEYQGTSGTVVMNIRYTGDIFDPRGADNALALKLLGKNSASFSHGTLSDASPYTNEVTVTIN